MSTRISQRRCDNNESHEINLGETIVEFPPSPRSKFCTKPNPDVICESVTWSVKAGGGKFNVKLYVLDTQANTRIDLKVNSKYFVKGETIDKGRKKVYQDVVESDNEYLTLSSECMESCENAMAKINMIEIYPYNENAVKPVEDPQPEQELSCGGGIIGGKCDKGPDVTHCVFNSASVPTAVNCTGNLVLVQIPESYKCNDQRNKFKCVKRNYESETECKKYCPKLCQNKMCI